jgi:nicotinamide-nucleotide amidase
VEQRLGDLTARGRAPEVGITAHEATISLRIVARGATESECQSQIYAASAAIHAALGDRVFGSDETGLEDVVLQQLAERGWSLVTLECGSSAYLAPRLIRAATNAGPDNKLIAGSYCFTSASLAQAQFARQTTSFADQCTSLKDLAQAARELAGANVCLAVLYPPIADRSTRSAGEVVAVGPDFAIAQHPTMLGSPDIQHSRLAKTAVDVLRRQLMSAT